MAIVVEHPLGTLRFPEGTTEEQINQSLVELEATYGEQAGFFEAAGTQFGRGFTSTARGIEELFLGELAQAEEDRKAEFEARVAEQQQPVAGFLGRIAGDVADPVGYLLPFQKLGNVFKTGNRLLDFVLTGSAIGAAAGAIEPVYEEIGDSRVLNTLYGTGIGAGLGGAARGIERLIERPRLGSAAKETAEAEALNDEVSAAIQQVEEAAAPKPRIRMRPEAVPTQRTVPETTATPVSVQEAAPPGINAKLPRFLAGAKPRFNQNTIEFDNDLDRVFYIVGNPNTKSKREDDYLEWASQVLGVNKGEVKAIARTERQRIVSDLRQQVISGSARGTDGPLKIGRTAASEAFVQNRVKRVQADIQQAQQGIQTLQEMAAMTPQTVIDGAAVARAVKPRIRLKTQAQQQMQQLQQAAEVRGSVGAARAEPLRTTEARRAPQTIQRAFEGEATPAFPGRVEPFRNPLSNDLFDRLTTLTPGGRRRRRGRVETQGRLTDTALTKAGVREINNMLNNAETVEDFIKGLDAAAQGDVQLSALQIVASAPVQARIDNLVSEITQDYASLIQRYGSVDKIPAEDQRYIAESLFESMYIKEIISGSLSKASSQLNAQRLVNKLKRRDEAVTELFGTRCY